MKSTQSDLEIQILFALLRSGIWQKKDSALNEINLSSDSWSAVYEYAKAQGVLSIVYDGISFLEHNQMPPDDLLLNWGINARMQAAKYEKYCEVLQDIENYAETNNLKILFF